MFNKLRNNYLFTNFLLLGGLLIISFLSMYFIIFRNIQSNNYKQLEAVQKDNKLNTAQSFYVEMNENNEIISESYTISLNSYELETLVNKTKNTKGNSITFEDKTYLFEIKEDYKTEHQSLVFVNITQSVKDLKNLAILMFLVLLIALGIIFLICIHLANKSVEKLKEAWLKQRQFIMDASHELKTPLTVITSNTDALLLEGNNQWLKNIKSETKRMDCLLTDLLYLSRIDDYDFITNKTKVNLSDLLEKIIRSYEVKIFEKGIDLKTDIQEEIIIHEDEEQIKQVIHILLDNALKYSKEIISVKLMLEFNQITLTVENDGPGIAQEHLNKVFDRFFMQDESRSDNSYGLGLSIAKSIVVNMNGELFVQSVRNEKTRFTLLLDL